MKWPILFGLALGLARGGDVQSAVPLTDGENVDDALDNQTDLDMQVSPDLNALEEQLTSLVGAPNKGKRGKMQNTIGIMITKTMLPTINREHRAAQKQLNSLWRAFLRCRNPAKSRRSINTYAWMLKAKKVHRVCRYRQAKVGKLTTYWCRLNARRLRAKRLACNALRTVKRNPANLARHCKASGATRYGVWVTSIVRHFSIKKRRYLYFKKRCLAASRLYFKHQKKCGIYRRSYRGYRRRCYSRQTAVDTQACAYRLAVRQSCYAYRRCYNKAWRAFVYRQRLIRKAEADRKIQYRVLKRIMCLLKNPINSGKKKDIMKCRKKIWGTRHLNLKYPRVPKRLRCAPARVARPCTSAYKRSVYGRLPKYGRAQRCRQCGKVVRKVTRVRTRRCRPKRAVFAYNRKFYAKGGCYLRGGGLRARLPMKRHAYTLEAWILPKKKNANGGFVGYGAYGRKNQVNAFRQYGNKGLVNIWWANDLAKNGLTIQNGKWHHVAATFDGFRRRLFLDFRPVAYRHHRNNYKLSVRTKKNFCIGKTYKKEYFKGWMHHVMIWPTARSGSLMKARGRSTPRIWMKGYYGFSGRQCLYRRQGARANLPLGKSPYSIEARIRPSRKSHWSGGIVGYGSYRRKNAVNAFRIAGRDGLYNYYWGNDLYASAYWVKRYGRRVHDGRYHKVAATFDGWYQRIYVDLRVVRWRRTSGPVSLKYKRNFCIGKTYGKEYFKGRMGDVRVYRWARSVADMKKRGC